MMQMHIIYTGLTYYESNINVKKGVKYIKKAAHLGDETAQQWLKEHKNKKRKSDFKFLQY